MVASLSGITERGRQTGAHARRPQCPSTAAISASAAWAAEDGRRGGRDALFDRRRRRFEHAKSERERRRRKSDETAEAEGAVPPPPFRCSLACYNVNVTQQREREKERERETDRPRAYEAAILAPSFLYYSTP